MDGNIYVSSQLVQGGVLHPTLPVSYWVEEIPVGTFSDKSTGNSVTIQVTMKNSYPEPFFQSSGFANCFYMYPEVGSDGKTLTITIERMFTKSEGRYYYYYGAGTPMILADAHILVGCSRG